MKLAWNTTWQEKLEHGRFDRNPRSHLIILQREKFKADISYITVHVWSPITYMNKKQTSNKKALHPKMKEYSRTKEGGKVSHNILVYHLPGKICFMVFVFTKYILKYILNIYKYSNTKYSNMKRNILNKTYSLFLSSLGFIITKGQKIVGCTKWQ